MPTVERSILHEDGVQAGGTSTADERARGIADGDLFRSRPEAVRNDKGRVLTANQPDAQEVYDFMSIESGCAINSLVGFCWSQHTSSAADVCRKPGLESRSSSSRVDRDSSAG